MLAHSNKELLFLFDYSLADRLFLAENHFFKKRNFCILSLNVNECLVLDIFINELACALPCNRLIYYEELPT